MLCIMAVIVGDVLTVEIASQSVNRTGLSLMYSS